MRNTDGSLVLSISQLTDVARRLPDPRSILVLIDPDVHKSPCTTTFGCPSYKTPLYILNVSYLIAFYRMGLDIFGTSNYTDPRWTPNPDTRGTSGLILTCLITLALSVYSTLHLNVFDRQCKWWVKCLVKAKWVVIALLAPEFVVFNAWSQRRHALRIAEMLRRRSGQREPDPFLMTLRKKFRMVHPEPDQEQGIKGNSLSSGDPQDEASVPAPVCEDGDAFGTVYETHLCVLP